MIPNLAHFDRYTELSEGLSALDPSDFVTINGPALLTKFIASDFWSGFSGIVTSWSACGATITTNWTACGATITTNWTVRES